MSADLHRDSDVGMKWVLIRTIRLIAFGSLFYPLAELIWSEIKLSYLAQRKHSEFGERIEISFHKEQQLYKCTSSHKPGAQPSSSGFCGSPEHVAGPLWVPGDTPGPRLVLAQCRA